MTAPKKKRINWALRRLGFFCRCDSCVAITSFARSSSRTGRFWQARYGESAKDFRKRYLKAHPAMRHSNNVSH